MDLAEHARLVADVQQRFLAQARLEATVGERQRTGIAADDADLRVQPDHAREPGGAGGAAGVELHRDHGRAASAGHEARRAAESGAEVEHAGARVDAGQAGQGVHRGEAAVVILVEVEQVVGGEWERWRAPRRRRRSAASTWASLMGWRS